MVFNSLVFLFLFLPLALFFYFISNDRFKNYVLLIFSLLFYAWGEPKYIFLMLLSIFVNYILSIKISNNDRSKLFWFIISIVYNIGILAVFKYAHFIVSNINYIIHANWTVPDISLPLGISFYTFQIISYIIDVYRDDAQVQKNVFDLALYISLFPKLISGPIVQYRTIDVQIKKRKHSIDKFAVGVERVVIGLAKKVILSNQLGIIADSFFNSQISNLSVSGAWLGALCYTLQIYYDFSGYSDIAIGLGKMIGFDFMENFNYPYISQSASEFWRRWHISLGSWFRDYVYIPLGGSRVTFMVQCRNLLIVWFLTGLWHGANWTFILWGLYYGVIIIAEKSLWGKLLNKLPKIVRHIYSVFVIMIGWVIFRSENIIQAKEFIKAMMNLNHHPLYDNLFLMYISNSEFLLIFSVILAIPVVPKLIALIRGINKKFMDNKIAYILYSVFLMSLMLVIVSFLVNSTYQPFLYFKF